MNDVFVWLIMMLPLNKRWLYRRFYLRSNHWQNVKRDYKMGQCEKCGKEYNLDLHHRTYYNRKGQSILWREQERHLQTLCRSCHNQTHER